MRPRTKWLEQGLFLFLVGAGLAWPGAARAQDISAVLRGGPKVMQAFRPVVSQPSRSTVRIRCGGKDVAFGTIVSTDGWIITKNSVLGAKDIVCRFKDGSEQPARLVGAHEPYDLALLKVSAKGLAPITWRDSKLAAAGKWVVTVGPGAEPVAIGVVGVGTRLLKPGDQPLSHAADSGFLGVQFDKGEGGVKIMVVIRGTAAEKAGLKINDVVTHIDTKKVVDPQSVMATLQRYKAGAVVEVRLKRGKEDRKVKATLGKRPLFGNPQDRMGSTLSNRRGGFPSILQHDAVVQPHDCGGPLVDLDGLAVGINIARAGRTESYAVPSEAIRELLPALMAGKFAPRKEEARLPKR